MQVAALRVARRPRDYVGVRGPDAASYLQAMVSNDVEALAIGDACEALLLTSKARVIAPLVVLRRGRDDFLLLTEDGLGPQVRTTLARSRFAAKCDIEPEEHSSVIVFGNAAGIPTADFGEPAAEVLDATHDVTVADDELELMRIRAGTPRFGLEVDDRVLPAEAGLDARAIDFEKGCYPGQEPIARQHYRGRVNRTLRVLEIEGTDLPEYDAELTLDGKVVGRLTSSARNGNAVVALGYVRVEVPGDATLRLGQREVRPARFELAASASAGQRSIP
jgi:folate-binding protein YgfZ